MIPILFFLLFFFINDPATTTIYTLSLHDALPIFTEQSVRFQTALASIKLIQASAVLDLTEDDFDFLTSNKVWIATDRSRARRCVEAKSGSAGMPRSEERFSRNAETDLVCRLLLEKKKTSRKKAKNEQRENQQTNNMSNKKPRSANHRG